MSALSIVANFYIHYGACWSYQL